MSSIYIAPTIDLVCVEETTDDEAPEPQVFKIPSDVLWVERNITSNVVQDVEHTIGGSAVINNGVLLGGIPFTLRSRAGVWFTHVQMTALVNESRTNPEKKYTLLLAGETTPHELCWRHDPAAAFEPVLDKRIPDDELFYTGTLQFWEQV